MELYWIVKETGQCKSPKWYQSLKFYCFKEVSLIEINIISYALKFY